VLTNPFDDRPRDIQFLGIIHGKPHSLEFTLRRIHVDDPPVLRPGIEGCRHMFTLLPCHVRMGSPQGIAGNKLNTGTCGPCPGKYVSHEISTFLRHGRADAFDQFRRDERTVAADAHETLNPIRTTTGKGPAGNVIAVSAKQAYAVFLRKGRHRIVNAPVRRRHNDRHFRGNLVNAVEHAPEQRTAAEIGKHLAR